MRDDTAKPVLVSGTLRGALLSWLRKEFEGCCWMVHSEIMQLVHKDTLCVYNDG